MTLAQDRRISSGSYLTLVTHRASVRAGVGAPTGGLAWGDSTVDRPGAENQKPNSLERWLTPVIPAFRRLRQEKCEFQVSLGYTVGQCLKNKYGGRE